MIEMIVPLLRDQAVIIGIAMFTDKFLYAFSCFVVKKNQLQLPSGDNKNPSFRPLDFLLCLDLHFTSADITMTA